MQNHEYQENPDLIAHAKITRNSASEGMVLLKNESVLPIQPNLDVALLGVTSYQFIEGGTDSGDVNEAYSVFLEEDLTNAGFEINKKGKEVYQSHKLENVKGFEKSEGLNALFNPFAPFENRIYARPIESNCRFFRYWNSSLKKKCGRRRRSYLKR
tara:strand:+ start:483 stop:950 length:468 start_codon:yes stop_codon:yes gene_type:complete